MVRVRASFSRLWWNLTLTQVAVYTIHCFFFHLSSMSFVLLGIRNYFLPCPEVTQSFKVSGVDSVWCAKHLEESCC